MISYYYHAIYFMHSFFSVLSTDKENKQHIIDNGGISLVVNCLSRYM